MDPMRENLIFLKGLLAKSDDLQLILGDDWPAFQAELQKYLRKLTEADDDEVISLWVDQIYEFSRNSSAAPLVKSLRDEARSAGQIQGEMSLSIRLPTSDDSQDQLEEVVIPMPDQPRREDVVPAARDLAASLEQSSESNLEFSVTATPHRVKTYPNLRGQNAAYLNQDYTLTIKLSDQPQQEGEHSSASPLEVEAEEGEQIKKIQVVLHAPDFDLVNEAEGWQRTLTLYLEARASSEKTFTLRPQDRFAERYFAGLKLQFLAGGEVIGEAFRWVEVLQSDRITPSPFSKFPEAPTYPLDEAGKTRSKPAIPPHHHPLAKLPAQDIEHRIHLTVTIEEDADDANRLNWYFASPYLPEKSLEPAQGRNLGAEEFVKQYLAPFGLPGHWGKRHMDDAGRLFPASILTLQGVLIEFRNSAPERFWQIYQDALQAHLSQGLSPETFTLLFRTGDTHIPWELMPTTEESGPDKVSPLLGNAHRVGRWLQGIEPYLPPETLNLEGFALAAPVYIQNPLPEAQKEREFIKKYKPYPILDTPTLFRNFMKDGRPTGGTGILHFAGHGDCCTDEIRGNWLVLSDEGEGDWYDIRAAGTDLGNGLGKLGRDVVAFFNACNVGRSASGPLGSNGGWGRALLAQQYKGYVGPLWSVYDEHARDISETFYNLALTQQLPLGEVMRQIRLKFDADNHLYTYLAYLYLGHPLARINFTVVEGA